MSAVLSIAPRFGRQLGFLPRHGIVPHGDAVQNVERGSAADGSEDDDVVLSAEIFLARNGLGADVIERHARGIEGIAPPAFRLSSNPSVHEGDARSRDRVDGHGRRRAEPRASSDRSWRTLASVVAGIA